MLPGKAEPDRYPFNVAAFRDGLDLEVRANVTFFVGENGSGKSTLLEAVAKCCGFNPLGGGRDQQVQTHDDSVDLASTLRLSWLPKATEGFFMRAKASSTSRPISTRSRPSSATAVGRYTSNPTANPLGAVRQPVRSRHLHPRRARGRALTAEAAFVSENHSRPRGRRPSPVPDCESFADPARLSRSDAAELDSDRSTRCSTRKPSTTS